jgi:hypothetical protein
MLALLCRRRRGDERRCCRGEHRGGATGGEKNRRRFGGRNSSMDDAFIYFVEEEKTRLPIFVKETGRFHLRRHKRLSARYDVCCYHPARAGKTRRKILGVKHMSLNEYQRGRIVRVGVNFFWFVF